MVNKIKRRKRLHLLFVVLLSIGVGYILFFADREGSTDPSIASEDVGQAEQTPDVTTDPSVVETAAHQPKYIIVIDPGHGGKDGGAIGASGQLEKDFTLQLSMKVKQLLEEEVHIGVHMTRTDDSFISSVDRERAQIANELGADLFISIHGNTFNDSSVSGTESYYYDDGSHLFATVMHRAVVRATGFRDRGVRVENYFVLKETDMPAVLLEVGYLTNAVEEKKMWDEAFQEEVAAAIVAGIKEYLEQRERT